MSHEEIEVKFIVDDLPATRQRVLDMGAQLKTPRTYEDNVLFDTPEHRLQKQALLLRLRRDQRHILTCKEPPLTADADYKVLNEYEVEVSDPDQMHTILEKLGFLPTMRYEKYRETFRYRDAEILLDETPVGTFVEIEASRTAIGDIATRLGLDFKTRLTSGYQDIFRAVCATYNLHLTDMTFDNFQTRPIDLRVCNLT
jgi:adenylate cyclase class 2